jgi:hypothetical protein
LRRHHYRRRLQAGHYWRVIGHIMTVSTDESQLRRLIRSQDWMMTVLQAARDCQPPDWFVGAGVIRNLVWDHLHGYTQPTPARDVDLAFFDPDDFTPERDTAVTKALQSRHPAVNWEATNQAAVHLWYAGHFGKVVPPFTSCAEAIATCESGFINQIGVTL